MAHAQIQLSVVIPIHNEEQNIPELWRRLSAVLQELAVEREVLFVDDGSSDSSPRLLDELCGQDKSVKVITLSRNFGHQAALSAGVQHAAGQAVVVMDGDLQDRPEAISDFVREWRNGYQVVYAVRQSRREHPILRFAFRLFYRMLARMSGIRQPLDAGIFCLADRKVIDIIKAMPEKHRYFPGLRAYAGYRQIGVPVERDARFAGAAQVGIYGLIRLSMDAFFSFSYVPLRVATFVGLIIASCSTLFLISVVIRKIIQPHHVAMGIASSLVAILLMGGLQLIMLGIVGEYIGRIYEETKRRPYYVIGEKKNFEA